MDEIITDETLARGDDVAPGDGGEADLPVSGTENIANIKDVLAEVLGKEFPSDEVALKAVKDTFSYIGEYGQVKPILDKIKEGAKGKSLRQAMEELIKPQETVETPKQESPDVLAKIADLETKLQESTFYAENPELKPYASLIKSLGSDPKSVVESETFKTVYEKLKTADEMEKSKSVLQSNPRLGQVTDKLSEAREAVKTGNSEQAQAAAVSAVLDIYESK